MAMSLRQRFDRNYIVLPDGCWFWLGFCSDNGYGRLPFNRVPLYAHRVAWELAHGPISDGSFVLHRCDVRSCVNSDHLFLGTQADNMADMVAKGRQYRPRSEDVSTARLNWSAVRAIRHRIADGETLPNLAREYAVTHETIRCIARGKSWKETA